MTRSFKVKVRLWKYHIPVLLPPHTCLHNTLVLKICVWKVSRFCFSHATGFQEPSVQQGSQFQKSPKGALHLLLTNSSSTQVPVALGNTLKAAAAAECDHSVGTDLWAALGPTIRGIKLYSSEVEKEWIPQPLCPIT